MSKNAAQRLRHIARVLAYYGFGYIVDNKMKKGKNPGQNLRKACEELGPTFIKIGQILSTRPDLLPSEYIEELQKLQDRVPSVNFDDIKNAFYGEFKIDIEEAFSFFEKTPLASASVAQVHRATLKNGRDVIVKVMRPKIKENMELDIAILKRILSLTAIKFEDSLIDPREALDEILISTRRELNFINEAKSIEKFKQLNSEVKYIGVPEVIWDFTSHSILTMEYIDGIKITDVSRLEKEGYDPKDIGKKLILSYFKQIFEDGFFHGDPHPGNLLVMNGKIYYIDFGIIGLISDSLKNVLNDVIVAIAYKDIDMLISALLAIGIRKGHINRNKLYEDIDYLFTSYLSVSLENIKISQLLQDIFETSKRNNIRLPKDLTLLIRSLVIIEGVVAKISPDIKILDIAIPYVKSNMEFKLIPDFNDLLIGFHTYVKDMVSLPSKLIRLSNAILSGRIKIQFEHRNLSQPIHELSKMINRIVFAFIVSSLIISSSFILTSNIGPKIYGVSIIGITGFIIAAFMGLWLLISILKSGRL
ncbi:ABC1 kinase family protein [Fonticella tunisiensis]|uniref:Ubiquinone biosynthesis protein n=1 Tax=Fonticella tunisiensis TaxID=1096341 RepID=A0A4R7KUG2_9CLOT|nr:AarF/ABC1/UbiB kinase family protein [Fonticella tunisiensis]TDT63354.1 ubiquinone biosynthesis protein [Fonticella tunisiensis]